MRIGQFLFLTMVLIGLNTSANAQVSMRLGGPETYTTNPNTPSLNPNQKRLSDRGQYESLGSTNPIGAKLTGYQQEFSEAPSLPTGNLQVPTPLPSLEPGQDEGTAPRISGEYQPSPLAPSVLPQAIPREVGYPDPVTLAPQGNIAPAPIEDSDFIGQSAAPQIQYPQPQYQPLVNSVPANRYETQGDYQSVVGSTFALSSNDIGASCGCESGSEVTGDSYSGLGDGRGNGSRRGLFTRRRGNRSRAGNSRAGNRIRQLGSGKPAYMFVDFGGYFGEGTGNLNGISIEQGDNLLFGAGFGRYLTDDLRIDLSGRYRFAESEFDLDVPAGSAFGFDGGTEIFTTMLTGRYSLPGFNGCIKPYFSAGVGAAYGRSHATAVSPFGFGGTVTTPAVNSEGFRSDEETTFAYVLGGGLALKMTDKMYFDLDYQYIDFGNGRETGPSSSGNTVVFDDQSGHEVAFRLRFNF